MRSFEWDQIVNPPKDDNNNNNNNNNIFICTQKGPYWPKFRRADKSHGALHKPCCNFTDQETTDMLTKCMISLFNRNRRKRDWWQDGRLSVSQTDHGRSQQKSTNQVTKSEYASKISRRVPTWAEEYVDPCIRCKFTVKEDEQVGY